MEIVKGDAECSRCGGNYFSEGAGESMKEYNLCWPCTTDYYKQVGPGRENLSWEEWLAHNTNSQ